ncbi:hypothetical protein HOG11_04410 [bacterium]|nr:hypothetical protein [bacterium]
MVGGTNILFEKLVDNNTTLGYISKCKRTYTPNEIYTQDETVISTLAYFEPKSKDTKYRGIRLNLEDNNFDFDLFKQTASTFRFLGNQETLSSDWIINLSDQESKSNVSLEKNNLLYATKKDFTVTVYKKSLQTDSQEIILEYNEFKKAESSGSWWTKSKPSISLSPDNNSLAFIDQEGLKIYDLLNKNTTTIISKIDDNYPGMPSWSITDLEAYHLFHPKWSSDSQYISFSQSLHEGSFIGVINIKNNEYTNLRLGNGLKTVTWSPIGNTLAKANDGGYSGVGLWIISDNIKNSQNIAETFNLGGMSFYDVNFSSSGDKVIFTFKDNNNYHLSISDIDGSNYKELDNGTSIKSPIFSRNDDSIYYIKQNYLYSFNLETSEISNIATIPESFTLSWTDDDHLILDGSRTTSIINLENEEILYSRPVSENFFKFMEIIN